MTFYSNVEFFLLVCSIQNYILYGMNSHHFSLRCFSIQPLAVGNNLVYGSLKLNKNFVQAVDYEKYDTIFLSIMVKDLNQQINDGFATGKSSKLLMQKRQI